MTINTMIDDSNKKLERLGGRSNDAESKAILQQQNTYFIMRVLAQNLPLVKTVFEAIFYGSFVFIVMIAMFPVIKKERCYKKYCYPSSTLLLVR
jgi:hypothetical protein